MSNKKSPAYQWYPKDILSSARVAAMDLRTECAYRRALDFCWLNESLPNNAKKLAMIIGKGCTVKIAESVMEMFIVDEKNTAIIRHERLDSEREKQAENRAKSVKGGLASAEKRQKESQPPFNQTPNQESTDGLDVGSNQSPTLHIAYSSSSLSKERKRTIPPLSPTGEFDYFFKSEKFDKAWEEYLNYRKDKHKFRYKTAESYQRVLNSIRDLSGGDEEIAIKILQRSIDNGWKGLFRFTEDELKQMRAAPKEIETEEQFQASKIPGNVDNLPTVNKFSGPDGQVFHIWMDFRDHAKSMNWVEGVDYQPAKVQIAQNR